MNVDFRNFDASGFSLYEIDFAGNRGNFTDLVNDTVIRPLNHKFGERVFKLVSSQGDVVRVNFNNESDMNTLIAKFNNAPPASLTAASPARIEVVAQTEKAMIQVAQINPEAVKQLSQNGNEMATKALDAMNSF